MIDILIDKIIEKNNPSVVGLNPRLSLIPQFIKDEMFDKYGKTPKAVAEVYYKFNKIIIDEVYDIVPAIKPQIAMYEQLGDVGVKAYIDTINYAKEKDLVVIGDIKRGDIFSTAQSYSEGHIGRVDIDGEKYNIYNEDFITINPFLGYDSIEPYIKDCKEYSKGLFILVKTSNPNSGQIQDLIVDGEKIYEILGKLVSQWGKELIGRHGYSLIGAVVGATHPKQGKILRNLMPNTFFLVPGYGAQGGTASDLKDCFDKNGLGAIVNSSRGIIAAYKSDRYKNHYSEYEFGKAARQAAIDMKKGSTGGAKLRAELILENGMIFTGRAFGHIKEAVGEIIFNTSMAGYQEIITDPSNYGKIITMTYPLMGNYGLNLDDNQSNGPKIKALIVREKSDNPSNWRNEITLDDYLKQHEILGLEGIDTRALTRVIREEGSMKAIITMRELIERQKELHFNSISNDLSFKRVSTMKKYFLEGSGKHVGIIDLGVRKDVIDYLNKVNIQVTVYPYDVAVDELLNDDLDGVLISNGPGNPKSLMELVDNIQLLLGKIPLFGIGLGNQVLALSLGADVFELKYGHRGGNLPVKDIINNRVLISSQNHGFEVIQDSLPEDVKITHKNLNDESIEGIENKKLKSFGVDFYPDEVLYNKFIDYMEGM